MTCENCGAPMHLARNQLVMVCDYCGHQTTPPTDDDGVRVAEATSHHCPVCDAQLANGLIESQEMLYCTGCHGMLFNMEKFVPLLQVLRERRYRFSSSQPPLGVDAGRVLHCPLCKREMDKHAHGNRHYDSCRPCMVMWLDRGELGTVVAA
jgi:Zn-finger nucleic acid-binding protein